MLNNNRLKDRSHDILSIKSWETQCFKRSHTTTIANNNNNNALSMRKVPVISVYYYKKKRKNSQQKCSLFTRPVVLRDRQESPSKRISDRYY